MEDKKRIAEELGNLLKMTRQFDDLDTCEYVKDSNDDEYVIITGKPNEHGYCWNYHCNVTWDSGIAMIRDVLRQIS